MEKWKAKSAFHFPTPPTATGHIYHPLRYTNNLAGTKDRAGQAAVTGLTQTQSQTYRLMRAIVAAPLQTSTDLKSIAPETLAILTKPEVFAVNQDAPGSSICRNQHNL